VLQEQSLLVLQASLLRESLAQPQVLLAPRPEQASASQQPAVPPARRVQSAWP
jgi:hypothetical protein